MKIDYKIPKKTFNIPIREIDLNGLKTGGEKSLLFMGEETESSSKPLVGCEILTNIPKEYPELLKQAWGEKINDPVEWAKAVKDQGFSILNIRFNIENCENIDYAIEQSKEQFKEILAEVDLPVIATGCF